MGFPFKTFMAKKLEAMARIKTRKKAVRDFNLDGKKGIVKTANPNARKKHQTRISIFIIVISIKVISMVSIQSSK